MSAAVADGLRRRAIEVTTTLEADLEGAEDATQIAFCRASERVLVTHDRDFLCLHSQRVDHAGIVFVAKQTRSPGGMIRILELLSQILDPDEMKNKVEFL